RKGTIPRPRTNRIQVNARTPYASPFHFNNRRDFVLAIENGCAGHIYAQPEYELASRRGQPVGFMACRGGVLNVDVDGAVSVRYKAGAIAHAVSIDWIRHKPISRVSHCQRPECVVG